LAHLRHSQATGRANPRNAVATVTRRRRVFIAPVWKMLPDEAVGTLQRLAHALIHVEVAVGRQPPTLSSRSSMAGCVAHMITSASRRWGWCRPKDYAPAWTRGCSHVGPTPRRGGRGRKATSGSSAACTSRPPGCVARRWTSGCWTHSGLGRSEARHPRLGRLTTSPCRRPRRFARRQRSRTRTDHRAEAASAAGRVADLRWRGR
jgi:hypothetical protein